ncbi:hypothetical protein ACFRNT_41270 [Streptomyces sp. NPDC056697]|uniref:hypothetical protein n=1 Tax=Streptomyces sp. NPDC056697 TaxID=3345915 RepID=UPI003682AB18
MTGRPYGEAIAARILRPLDLARTVVPRRARSRRTHRGGTVRRARQGIQARRNLPTEESGVSRPS